MYERLGVTQQDDELFCLSTKDGEDDEEWGFWSQLDSMTTEMWFDMTVEPMTHTCMGSITSQILTNYFQEVIKWLRV